MEKIDLAIIGGGIVGLNVAYAALLRHPDWTVAVFEKERYLGEHTSGRNSGVMHAGLYYAEGSFKHRMCLEGRLIWKEWAPELNIPYQECGKFIVAKHQDELQSLEDLFKQAKLNAVPGIRRAKAEEVKELSEKLHCVAALYSPATGILDVAEAVNTLKHKVEALGGMILPYNPVLNVERKNSTYILETVTEKIEAQVLVNAAGLEAVKMRKMLGLNDLENEYVKGTYLKTSQKNEFRTLIYPLPQKKLKGLGVHLTFDFADQMKFGPNTESVNEIDYRPSESAIVPMTESIQSLFKTIDVSKLGLDYSGIRPKIKFEGNTHLDFWIKSPLPGYIEACGIESPGFTAAPAIARYIVKSWL